MPQSAISYTPETTICIHRDIRFHPGLTYAQKLFYAEIASLCNKDNENKFYYTSRKLMSLFGVSHQTILNWIRSLSNNNLLEVGVDYTNKTNQYLKIKNNNKKPK